MSVRVAVLAVVTLMRRLGEYQSNIQGMSRGIDFVARQCGEHTTAGFVLVGAVIEAARRCVRSELRKTAFDILVRQVQ